MTFRSENTDQTNAIAKEILRHLSVKDNIVLLQAEMGAGKTTLVTGIMRAMGVEDHVSSPTFSIVNEYFSQDYGKIYHFDFYRLEEEEEAYDIGVDELLEEEAYIFIEWGERIENLLPEKYVSVGIEVENEVRIINMNV